mmetsp:Transcript_6270/g.16330  ORF Transcript_6270/g.16330 Transcript_6270/m.16330 type:complete len:93 (-) Transcript_6270:263-541(-)
MLQRASAKLAYVMMLGVFTFPGTKCSPDFAACDVLLGVLLLLFDAIESEQELLVSKSRVWIRRGSKSQPLGLMGARRWMFFDGDRSGGCGAS